MYSILKPIKIYTQSGTREWVRARAKESGARPPKWNKMNGLFDERTVTTAEYKKTQHTIENFIFYSFFLVAAAAATSSFSCSSVGVSVCASISFPSVLCVHGVVFVSITIFHGLHWNYPKTMLYHAYKIFVYVSSFIFQLLEFYVRKTEICMCVCDMLPSSSFLRMIFQNTRPNEYRNIE